MSVVRELTLSPLHRGYRHAPWELSLDGRWEVACSPDSSTVPTDGWVAATVPGFVHWQLYEAGKIPHPYVGLNSRDLRWIEQKTWWYRRTFEVPEARQGKRLILSFDGLDYYAQIHLNGEVIARHEGAFGGPDIDVTDRMHSGSNELLVRLNAAGAGRGKPPENNSGSIVKSEAFGRWLNNPDLMTVGIWRGVRLQVLEQVALDRPFLRTLHADEQVAHLHLEVELAESGWVPGLQDLWGMSGVFSTDAGWQWRNQPLSEAIPLTVRVRFGEGQDAIEVLQEVKLDHRRQWVGLQFDVPRPKLWWPLGMGEQPLYPVRVELLQAGRIIDAQEFRHGIRTIAMVPSAARKKQDRWANWQMLINGKPLFVKGCNMMPFDLLNLSDERYRWFLAVSAQAGIQMLRINGCGLLESELFYHLCDEMGILVYQEFPLNCRWTCEDMNLDVLEAQVIRNIQRLRNHPSLAAWSGGNEFPIYDRRNAAAVGIMERSVRDFDGARPFFRASPDVGDQHPYPDYDTTWYLRDLGHLPAITEWGGHTMPSMQMLGACLPEEEVAHPPVALTKLDAEAFAQSHPVLLHHWTEFNIGRFPRAMQRASIFDDLSRCSLPDFCEAIQMGSGEIYETVAESFRANHPVTTLLMPWNLNRPWPTVAMQIIDHTGRVLPGYHALRRAYRPVCAAVVLPLEVFAPGEIVQAEVCVVCEDIEPRPNCHLRVRVLDPLLNVITDEIWNDAVGGWLQTRRFPITVAAPQTTGDACFFIVADVTDAQGQLLARSIHWPRVLQAFSQERRRTEYRSKPTTALQYVDGPWLKPQLQRVPTRLRLLNLRLVNAPARFGEAAKALRFDLHNTGDRPAFAVRITLQSEHLLAVPSDGHFWLDAGETRMLELIYRDAGSIGPFTCPVQSGDELVVEVDAWNAPVVCAAVPPGRCPCVAETTHVEKGW